VGLLAALRRRSVVVVPVVCVVALAGLITWVRRPAAPERAVAIASTEPGPSTIASLVDASDVIVIALARREEPGRVVADGGGAAVRSHLITLEVGAVLVGPDPGAAIVLDEEFELADGRPLVVDGLRPTRTGDRGIFVLSGVPDGRYVTVSSSGRFLFRPGGTQSDALQGAAGPLAADLAARGGNRLSDAFVARGRETGRLTLVRTPQIAPGTTTKP
jgi:hypothetical protein